MKKFLLCILILVFLLFSITACTPNSAGSSSGSPTELLNYPGLTWDMSPQEVTSALHLREDQIQTRDDEPSFALGYVPEGEIFGLKPANIVFEFLNIDSEQKLYNVTVTYPEGSGEDIETIKTALEEYYGPLQEEVILGPDILLSDPETMTVFQNQPNGDEFYWISDLKLQDLSWTDEKAARAQEYRQEQAPSEDFWKDDKCWQAYMETNPLATIHLMKLEYPDSIDLCQVFFSADYIGYERMDTAAQ